MTLTANADTSPEGLKKLSDYFNENFGVTNDMIAKRYQCRFESLRPAQIVQLRKISQSLKDGMSSVEDWFDIDYKANDLNALVDKTETE